MNEWEAKYKALVTGATKEQVENVLIIRFTINRWRNCRNPNLRQLWRKMEMV